MDTPSGIDDFRAGVAHRNTSTPSRPTLSVLQKALIEYATISSRLLFIQDPCVFTDFHHSDDALNNYSAMELSQNMLNIVLPNVQLYQLPEATKKRLRLLDLNPCFRKTLLGYQYRPECLNNDFVLQPKIDFSLPKQLPSLLSAQGNRSNSELESHTMLIDRNEVSKCSPKFELSYEIAAFLSAVFSTDLELSSSKLHDRNTMQMRLRSAKNNFETSGNMVPYRNNIDIVTNNIFTFEQLKKKLCRTLVN